METKYPIYIPSKGRADALKTARMFDTDKVPYRVVVQPDQVSAYAEWREKGNLLVLPEDGKGLVYARNWIKDHSISEGHERHWQFDDDISGMMNVRNGHRLWCDSGTALSLCEEFVDCYENVGLASPNSAFFVPCSNGFSQSKFAPFLLNARCYTAFLHMNSLPNRWRGRYNEDTDMTLQVLADGYCTVLFNAFLIMTDGTETNATGSGNKKGGGQASVYARDGRLQMARDLERVWPGVVTTKRRFNRPQHVVASSWMKFDNKLIRKSPQPKSRGIKLIVKQVKGEVQSPTLRKMLKENALQPTNTTK